MLRNFGCPIPIEMVRIKYLNNIVEQDLRTNKKRVRQMLGFKSFDSASATLEGIEVAKMIRKGRLAFRRRVPGQPAFGPVRHHRITLRIFCCERQ